jgi:polysaccharide deacetylase 2 family uncharacterized protein YibQ
MGRSLYAVHADIARAARIWGADLAEADEARLPSGELIIATQIARGPERIDLRLLRNEASGAPRIAIVIDDFGYQNDDLLERFLALPIAFTPAVLPGYAHSASSARRFSGAGRPPLLHLPMEPRNREQFDPGPGAVRAGMPAAEIRDLVARHLRDLDGIVGVSQHMGSRGSEEPGVIEPTLDAIAARDLLFLDSATTPRSVVPAEAAAKGVRCYTADLFLDGDPQASPATMRARMAEAYRLAEEVGSAILIAHARPATLRFLESIADSLARAPCRPVLLADLLR